MKKQLALIVFIAIVAAGAVYWRDNPNVKKIATRLEPLFFATPAIQKPAVTGVPAAKPSAPKTSVVPKPKPIVKPVPTFTAGGALLAPKNNTGAVGALTANGTITLTNQARANNGNLPSLQTSPLLNTVAERRLADMFAGQYFAHDSPDGVTPSDVAKAAGYSYLNFGENIALGNFASDRELVTAWMNSPHHRENIMGVNFTEIGVAVGQGVFKGEEVWMAVQVFGRPTSACPGPDKTLESTINSKTAEANSRATDLAKRKTELDTIPHSTQEEINVYNQKADEYNQLAAEYNTLIAELRSLTAKYNNEVNAFNACLGA